MADQRLVEELKQVHTSSLSLVYERGGYVDDGRLVEICFPEALPPNTFFWPAPYKVVWHTHPGGRGHRYEPPSGDDVLSAAEMSLDLGQAVEGYVLEKAGVWWYSVHVTSKMLEENPDFLQDLYFVAGNFATRLGGVEEEIDLYDEMWREPITSVEEYLRKWELNAPILFKSVGVAFYAM